LEAFSLLVLVYTFQTSSKIPLINCSNYDIVSDLCHQMLEEYPDYPIVASWLRGKSSISYSLRSQPDFDCSEIAKLYGGGGHKNSAGFKIAI
jgi:oligoribonuclease NrnB/cAMP/cGMP phosphodiesterase (DHH superfamily)